MAGRSRALRARPGNAIGAAVMLGLATWCALLGVRGDDAGLLFWGAAVFFAACAGRLLVIGVIVTSDGLTVRELHRTWKLPWAWRMRVDVQPNDQSHLDGPIIYNPTIHYRAPGMPRRQLRVASLGALRIEVAQARADELKDLIRRRGR